MKHIMIIISIIFLLVGQAMAEGYMPGSSIIDDTLEFRKLTDNCVTDIKDTIEATVGIDYTKRDGSQVPTDTWDFNGEDLSNVGNFDASTVSGDGSGLSNVDADTLDGNNAAHYLDRANHTGTQLSSTVSDFLAEVQSIIDDYSYNSTEIYTKSEIDSIIDVAKEAHRILYVRTDGNDSGSGSEIDPFLTIANAYSIAETMAPTSIDPVVINILGKFTEQVTADVNGIHFYGYGQGVSQWHYAGNALIIQDNGVDPEPWDMKIKGISFQSTDAGEYAVKIQGIAGTSLGGNEIQFMDCRLEGTKSIHTDIMNSLDYQNTYIMGECLYEQTSGIYYEGSESSGNITNDWDNAGTKPSDTSHYGINFVQHLPRGSVSLLHNGILGENYRPRELDDTGTSTVKIWSSDKISTALAAQDAASEINNDSSVSGLSVADALDSLKNDVGCLGSVFTQIELKADSVDSQISTVTLTNSGADDLQAALNGLVSGDVLEIMTNAVYNPVIFSTSEITVKAGIGYSPKIIGNNAITLSNGLHDVIIAGLILDNCTTSNQNYMGACVTFGSQGSKVQDIIFKDMAFVNVSTGSAIMLSYHGFTDTYYTDIADSDCSERVAFIDCVIHDACQDAIEGAAITLRAMKYPLISHCTINGADKDARGVLLQGAQNAMVRDNVAKNMQGNGEGIKIDTIGTAQFINTCILQKNTVQRCIEGIDVDDNCAAILYDNTGWECTEEAFSLDDSSQAIFKHCTAYNSVNGFRLEAGSSAEIRDCVSFNNSSNNYLIENGYSLPPDNSVDINDTEFAGTTANNTAYNSITYRSVDAALTYLISDKLEVTATAADSDKLDGEDGSYYTTASNITYDNTGTGLVSTNLQDVVGEAMQTVETIISNLELNDLDDINAGSPADGNVLTWDDGTSKWINEAPNSDADTLDGQDGSWYQDRANHTGTQLSSTVSDFLAEVQSIIDDYGYNSTEVYNKTELQTSGQSSVHWDNITNKPAIGTGDMTKIVYDTNDDGTVNSADTATAADDSDLLDAQEGSWYLDRANHTGTQLSSTVSDFLAEVQSIIDSYSYNSTEIYTQSETDTLLGGKLDTTGTAADSDKLDAQQGSWYQDRANHTGTQLAATVSDFTSAAEAVIDDYSYNSTEIYTQSETDSAISTGISNADLDDLADVVVDAPSDNDVLTYDTGTGTWTSEAAAGGVFEAVSEVIREKSAEGYDNDFVVGSPQLNYDGSHISRMFFDQSKSAFRAGRTAGTGWDEASRGNYSAAFGSNALASGDYSFAIGSNCDATGSKSFAGGDYCDATGSNSFAYGYTAIASGPYNATAIGYNVTARSSNTFALGNSITVGTSDSNAQNSIGIGLDTTARSLIQANTMAIMGGNVGIGNLTPSNALDVTGTIEVDNVVCQDTVEANAFKVGHASGYVREESGNLRFSDNYQDFTLDEMATAIDEKTTPAEVESIITEYSYDSTEVYTKSETDTLLGGKLDTTATAADSDKLDAQQGSWYQDRANHTGTQLAATVSDFTSAAEAVIDDYSYNSTEIYTKNEQQIIYPDVINNWVAAGGLPLSPNPGDRWACLVSGNGWTAGNIYEYNGSTWDETATVTNSLVMFTDNQVLGINAWGWYQKDSVTGLFLPPASLGYLNVSLNDLTDVDAGTLPGFDDAILKYDHANFEWTVEVWNGSGTSTAEVETIIDAYSYNSTEIYTKGETDSAISTGISNADLDDLADVVVDAPSDNDVLTYDSGTGTWTSEVPASSPVVSGSGTGSIKDNNCTAAGDYSTALGYGCSAATEGSVALGNTATVTDVNYGYSIGYLTSATGGYGATAIGYGNTASGTSALALGYSATAAGNKSVHINLDGASRTLSQTESMAITGGNVGIGNLTPNYALDVTGTVEATYFKGDGSALTNLPSSGPLEISSNVIRELSAEGYDNDFVVGSPQLTDDGNAAHDKRVFFDESKATFCAVNQTGTGIDTLPDESIIVGYNHTVDTYTGNSAIFGWGQTVTPGSNGYGNIVAGGSNTVNTGGCGYNAVFGQSNQLLSNMDFSIVSGSSHILTGAGSGDAVFGYDHTLTGSSNSFVCGSTNTLTSASSSFITGNLCKGTSSNNGFAGGYSTEVAATGSFVWGTKSRITSSTSFLVDLNALDTDYTGSSNNGSIGLFCNTSSGHVDIAAPSSERTPGRNGAITFWMDESGNNLKVKVRYSDGTYKTATIPFD